MAVRLLTCVGMDLELPLFRHFLDHYARLGIAPEHTHVILNTTDQASTRLVAAEALAAERGLPPPRRWIAPYTSDAMWAERRALQRRVARPDDWILNADVDEHHEYPDALEAVIAHCRRWRINVVQGVMIDRLGPGGVLAEVRETPALAEQFPLEADLAISLFGRVRGAGLDGTLKMMLHRGDIYPRRGGHNPLKTEGRPRFFIGERLRDVPGVDTSTYRFAFPFRVQHYKWTAGRLPKIEKRISTDGVSPDGLHFGSATIRYIERHGRIRLEDVAVAPLPRAERRRAWKTWALGMRIAALERRLRRRLL